MVNREQEQELNDIAENIPSVVMVGKKKVKVGWMKRGTLRKFTSIMLERDKSLKAETQATCKLAAAVVLNGFWKIKFYHWVLWRWYYYIRQYLDSELLPIIAEGKKKAQVEAYLSVMILAQELSDTHQVMTREEVNLFLQERSSAQKEQ